MTSFTGSLCADGKGTSHYVLSFRQQLLFSVLYAKYQFWLDHNGPVRSGPVRSGPVRSGPVRSGPVRSGPVRSGPVRSGPVKNVKVSV